MQIILLEKVVNLGQLGDVVKVKEGYARNFLIPQGKAKRATKANLAEFEQQRLLRPDPSGRRDRTALWLGLGPRRCRRRRRSRSRDPAQRRAS